MRVLQVAGNIFGQLSTGLFFDLFFALVFGFELRDLALQTAADPAVGGT